MNEAGTSIIPPATPPPKLGRNGKPKRAKAARPEMGKLTPKQQIFISEYISNGWNGKQAAITAGYAVPEVMASKLVRNGKVRVALNEALAAHHLSADEVLRRMENQATSNLISIIDAQGNIDEESLKRNGHLVKKIKVRTDKDGSKTVEFELYDAQSALLHVGKHIGLFKEKLEHSGKITESYEILVKHAHEL